MNSMTPSIMTIAADDFEAALRAGDDAQIDARMAIVRQFAKYADERLLAVGLSSVRHRGDGYVGVLADGREFSLPGSEASEQRSGTMQPLPYAPIGVTDQQNAGMLGSIPQTDARHY